LKEFFDAIKSPVTKRKYELRLAQFWTDDKGLNRTKNATILAGLLSLARESLVSEQREI
jgi:hypothetical protein